MSAFIHSSHVRKSLRWIFLCVFTLCMMLPSTGLPAQAIENGPNPETSRFTSLAASAEGQWDKSFGSPGMNGFVVRRFIVDGMGNLIAAGGFTNAGVVPANRIASWDGNNWAPLGSGLNNVGFALARDWNKNIYVGGNFTTAGGVSANRVAKWDGSSWSPLGTGIEGDVVRALAFDNDGNLYAGGSFTTAGGVPANNIAKWNGSTWSSLGTGTDGRVYALAVDGANIYAAGAFTKAGGVTVNYIAKWNGSNWYPLGDGMNLGIYSLEIADGVLYAAGTFTMSGGTTVNYIAKWDGSNWSSVGGGMDNHVAALSFDGETLYAGGYFTKAGGVNANRLAAWDGSSWSPLGSGIEGGAVETLLAKSSSELFVGGWFDKAGGNPAEHIARWYKNRIYVPVVLRKPNGTIPVAIPPPAPPSDLVATPLAVDKIQLDWTDNSDNEVEFIIENSPDGVTFSYYGTSEVPDIEQMWDIELGSGTTHCYRVYARNADGDSNPTNTACATTLNYSPPAPLSNLTAQVISSDRILLTWTNNSSCDGYKVYESVDGGPHSWVADVTPGNLPGIYVEDLPTGDTYSYRVTPFNSYGDSPFADSPISNTVDPPAVTSNTITRFNNNTVYPVVSLQVDGVEIFPTQPMGIPPGGYYQFELAAGSHTYRASTGFWSAGYRTEMYVYQSSFNQPESTTVQIPFNDPTISQILTRFSDSGYYTGDYWTGTLPNSAAFRFNSDGSYTFYRDGLAEGTGNYSMYEYTGNFMLKFQVTGYQSAIASMDERSSSFYMNNGPPQDWPTIQYTHDGY